VANLFQAGVAPPGSHLESLQRCRVPTYETSADPAIGTSVAIPRRDKAAIAKRDSALGGDAMTTTSEQRRSVSWLLALVGLMTTALAAAPAAATVFTVNDNGDAGDANPGDGVCATAGVVCTLRAAIDETNALAAGAPHDIRFSGALTIATASNFTVTRAGTVVDGITGNPDFAGTPVVEIDGSPGGGTALLVLDGGAATLRGLVVRGRAGNAGILLQSAANVVRGCYVGTNAAGTAAAPNGLGIAVAGDGATANVIGGTSPGDGNVISGQSPGTGIDLHNTTSNVIQGNFIGTDVSGTVAIPNTFGINIEVLGGNVIGGAAAGEGHVISGNDNTGLRISGANGNVVEGNLIGLDATGAGDLGNGNQGIRVDNAILNTIGGLAAGAGNVIAGNGDVGIRLASASSTTVAGNTIGLDASGTVAIGNVGGGVHVFSGAANRITRNRIASTVAGLAIDLDVDGVGSGDGVTPNDALDVDTGTNELQNFPVLNSALAGGGTTAIAGTLSSLPATTFTVELFASPSCHSSGNGDARTFLGATDVTTDGSGVAAVDYLHPAALVPGTVVTATATDPAGNTSELSACALVAEPLAPDLTVAKAHAGSFTQGQVGATYTIVVTNVGVAPTVGTTTVIDLLPAGLTATAMTGAGWTCTLVPLQCTSDAAIGPGLGFPAITLTVNVASDAPASVVNSVVVSGGGQSNEANDAASDPTAIAAGGVADIPAAGLGGLAFLAIALFAAGALALRR
jgi:uncharacterized repeat protein (TIGR01451 family)